MKIEIETIDGKRLMIDRIKEIGFTQSVGVACDSLWVSFFSSSSIAEIVKVRAYNNNTLIFNGLCDCQKSTVNKEKNEIYIYARSSAAILVDNEAQPFTYEKPSARQLCCCNTEKFGFVCKLPDIYSNMKYEVVKGTSCYGAVSSFVSLLTGESIFITPDNKIEIMKISDGIKNINKYKIVSACHTINRSEPYLQIIFKKSSFESAYNMHTKSQLADEAGIGRMVYINLSSLPQWQRENIVLQRLKKSYEDYRVLEIKVCGYGDERLLQRFSYRSAYEGFDDYTLYEKRYVYDENGEFTVFKLKKSIDLKEITYVD